MYVIDYDEVFRICLNDPATVDVLDDNPYEFHAEQPHSLGVYDNAPIHESGNNSLSYKFDPKENFVIVRVTIDEVEENLKFQTFSGDWFQASFSKCGNFILLAEPYRFDLYELVSA